MNNLGSPGNRSSNNREALITRRGLLSASEGRLRNHQLRHWPATDEVLLDNPVEVLGRAVPVPCAIGVDDGNRPGHADPEAVRAGAQHAPGCVVQPEFLQTPFQMVPALLGLLPRGALAAHSKE